MARVDTRVHRPPPGGALRAVTSISLSLRVGILWLAVSLLALPAEAKVRRGAEAAPAEEPAPTA